MPRLLQGDAGEILEIRPSLHTAMLLAALHGIALIGACSAPLWLGFPLVLLVLGSLVVTVRRDALRVTPESIVEVRHDREGAYWWRTRAGEELQGRLLPGGYVSPWLTLVQFRGEDGAAVRLVLMADAVDGEDFRLFRIRAGS